MQNLAKCPTAKTPESRMNIKIITLTKKKNYNNMSAFLKPPIFTRYKAAYLSIILTTIQYYTLKDKPA